MFSGNLERLLQKIQLSSLLSDELFGTFLQMQVLHSLLDVPAIVNMTRNILQTTVEEFIKDMVEEEEEEGVNDYGLVALLQSTEMSISKKQ